MAENKTVPQDRRNGPGRPGGRQGAGGRPGNDRRGRRDAPSDGHDAGDGKPEITEKVVFINRCAKVVKGGRRFSFSALIVAGDHQGKVGYGFGKANEVAEAIRKASETARKSMVEIVLQDMTIPHVVIGEHCGGRVLLRPASPGTGVIAGGGVRAVVEAAGVRDILAKSLGSANHANVVKATLKALESLRSKEEIFKLRGKEWRRKAEEAKPEPAAKTEEAPVGEASAGA